MNTTPNSKNVNSIMDAALETKDLYRIDIAVNAYADTWSHQNFAGVKDRFNKLDGVLPKILPDIGHADAMYKPDLPRYEWQDKRLLPEFEHIINNDQIIEAAESLFLKLILHINPNMNSPQVQNKWRPIKSEIQNTLGTYNKGNGNIGDDARLI